MSFHIGQVKADSRENAEKNSKESVSESKEPWHEEASVISTTEQEKKKLAKWCAWTSANVNSELLEEQRKKTVLIYVFLSFLHFSWIAGWLLFILGFLFVLVCGSVCPS